MSGGVTPHGLRYPGGDDPVYNVPAYLQNLAEDIDAKVAHAGAGPGKVYATWVGAPTFTKNGAYAWIPMPTIRVVRGAIVTQQSWSANAVTRPVLLYLYPAWTKGDWDQTWWNSLLVGACDPTKLVWDGQGHYYPDYFAGTVGLSVLAWGDPNPT